MCGERLPQRRIVLGYLTLKYGGHVPGRGHEEGDHFLFLRIEQRAVIVDDGFGQPRYSLVDVRNNFRGLKRRRPRPISGPAAAYCEDNDRQNKQQVTLVHDCLQQREKIRDLHIHFKNSKPPYSWASDLCIMDGDASRIQQE